MKKFQISNFKFQMPTNTHWKLQIARGGKDGFTLIELVVVIAILALLAVFLLAVLNPIDQFRKARDAQRKSDIEQIQRALEQYYQDNGKYPASSISYTLTDVNGNPLTWGVSPWAPYLNLLPKDPDTLRTYVYYATNNQQTYALYASLEKGPSDPTTCKATVSTCKSNPTSVQYCTCSGVPVGANCGGSTLPCNYGVSSPNTSP